MIIAAFCSDISIYNDRQLLGDHLGQLSDERKKKYNKFKNEKAARLSLLGGYLLDTALLEYGLREKDMTYVYNAYGKPSFANRPDILFGISHSGTKAMVCMLREDTGNTDAAPGLFIKHSFYFDFKAADICALGCDIQQIPENTERYFKVSERFFHPEEKEYIASFDTDDQKEAAFTKIWTLKESYVKALGTGFSKSLDSFGTIPNDNDVILRNENMTESESKCHFIDIPVPDKGYMGSLCIISSS